jgi:hypothetical protein
MRDIPKKAAVVAGVLALTAAVFGQTIQTGESNINVSGDMQLKWVGKGITNKLLDAEITISQGVLPDTIEGRFGVKTTMANVSLYFRPPKVLDIKLNLPLLIKQGPEGKTGPFGDLSLDICRKWGTAQNVITAVTLGFPIGYSSILSDRAKDEVTFMPPENQLGSGLFQTNVRASYMFSPDWGFLNIGCSYLAGLFAIRTTEYGYNSVTDKISFDKKTFQVARDGLGATNDAGVRFPDRINLFTDMGLKTESLIHTFSIGYFYPTASRKIYQSTKMATLGSYSTKDSVFSFLLTKYQNVDTTFEVIGQRGNGQWVYFQKTSTILKTLPFVTLQYGLEKNDMILPIFLGGMLKLDYDNRFLFGGFAIGLGFKFPVN